MNITQLEKEIIRVLKINENVDWDFSDIPPKEESKEVADQSLYCTFTLSQNERVAPHYIDVGRPLRRQAGGSDGPSDSRALGRAARKPSSKASAVAPSNLTLHQWCRTR